QSTDEGRIAILADARGTLAGHTGNDSASRERRQLAAVRSKGRRSTVPSDATHAIESQIPWVKTVIVVRRSAKRKAFMMLSLNLIFWLPYCAHAILATFVSLDYYNFQFSCALIVFNAITNLLL
ncbi:hypothetical protein PENTCL1PPCAC_16051, partial [Pristionchus entomophagus]